MLNRHRVRTRDDRFKRALHLTNRPGAALVAMLAILVVVIAGFAHTTNDCQTDTART
jgi:hypothetical protein